MSFTKKVFGGATCALLLTATLGTSISAQASDTGAFVGGLLAGKVMNNMHQRTEAEQQQAYYAQQNAQQQPVQQAAPAPAQKTTQQKLDELDKLAAGGYITPDEYKAKKQQIIDSM